MIPGRTLYRLAGALCSADMRERVIDAFFADCQGEWLDAPTAAGRLVGIVHFWCSFWLALAGCLAHDFQHDFMGFRARVLKPIARYFLPFVVSMAAPFAPSWVKTGHVDWVDAGRGLLWIGSFSIALAIAGYRSRNADRRAWLPFFLALAVAAAVMTFRALTRGQVGSADWHEWMFQVSLTMAWPFLVRKQISIVKSSH